MVISSIVQHDSVEDVPPSDREGKKVLPPAPTIIITITIKDYYEHYLYNYLFNCFMLWRVATSKPSACSWQPSLSLFFVDSILLFNTKNISTKGVSNTCVTYSTYLATKMFLVSQKIFCVIDCDRL